MAKIKEFLDSNRGKDILTVLIVILVGLGGFGLGRLSKDSASAGLKITYPDPGLAQPANVLGVSDSIEQTAPVPSVPKPAAAAPAKPAKASVGSTSSAGKAFFASKIGKKYYSIGCSGGKTIKQENRVYFSTEAEAVAAGFEKSASCK